MSNGKKFLGGLVDCIEVLDQYKLTEITKIMSDTKTKDDRITFDINGWLVTFKKKKDKSSGASD
jgi:hypothetical protein